MNLSDIDEQIRLLQQQQTELRLSRGKVWLGAAGNARPGMAQYGVARRGEAGWARQGAVRHGWARQAQQEMRV